MLELFITIALTYNFLMLQALGFLSGILGLVYCFPYIRDILKGKTKPERASWLIWTVLGSISFFSQLAKGATNSLWMTGADTLGVAIIYLLALHYGEGGLAPRDIKALMVASLGLVLWYFTKEPAFALFIVILVDGAGATLTILKAYENPGSETMSAWLISGLSGFVAALAVGSFNWILLSYPIYIWLANWAVIMAMILGQRKIKKSKI
jgi:hypothetical protein